MSKAFPAIPTRHYLPPSALPVTFLIRFTASSHRPSPSGVGILFDPLIPSLRSMYFSRISPLSGKVFLLIKLLLFRKRFPHSNINWSSCLKPVIIKISIGSIHTINSPGCLYHLLVRIGVTVEYQYICCCTIPSFRTLLRSLQTDSMMSLSYWKL